MGTFPEVSYPWSIKSKKNLRYRIPHIAAQTRSVHQYDQTSISQIRCLVLTDRGGDGDETCPIAPDELAHSNLCSLLSSIMGSCECASGCLKGGGDCSLLAGL